MLTSIAGDDMNMEEGREYEVAAAVGKTLCSDPSGDGARAVVVAVKQADTRETR